MLYLKVNISLCLINVTGNYLVCSIADTEHESIVDDAVSVAPSSSMMDFDAASTRASSELDVNQSIYISDDDGDDAEAKIIKEAEKKISNVIVYSSIEILISSISRESKKKGLAFCCVRLL